MEQLTSVGAGLLAEHSARLVSGTTLKGFTDVDLPTDVPADWGVEIAPTLIACWQENCKNSSCMGYTTDYRRWCNGASGTRAASRP